jgi:hypothetical protein
MGWVSYGSHWCVCRLAGSPAGGHVENRSATRLQGLKALGMQGLSRPLVASAPETLMDLLDPGACGNQMDSAAAMGQTALMRRSWRPYSGETA